MSFEGSITPPMSDNEDWNTTENSNLPTSPVLVHKKARLECNQGAAVVQVTHSHPFRIVEHFKLFKMKIKQPVYAFPVGLSYEVKMHLSRLEVCSANCDARMKHGELQDVDSILNEIQVVINNLIKSEQEDQVWKFVRSFLAVAQHVSSVLDDGIDCLFNQLSTKSISESMSLHDCGNNYLIKWFHSFCTITNLLLDFTVALLKDPPKFHSVQTLLAGFSPKVEGNLLDKFIRRVIQQLEQLSSNLFKKLICSNDCDLHTMLSQYPYPCTCFVDLLTKCLSLSSSEDAFWITVSSVINSTFLSPTHPEDITSIYQLPDLTFEDLSTATSFLWWWTRKMPFNVKLPTCHHLITRLLRLTTTHSMHNDESFAFQLHCLKDLLTATNTSATSHLWSASELSFLQGIWAKIIPHLSTVSLKKTNREGIRRFLAKDIIVQEWVTECENLQQSVNSTRDVFKIFLMILDLMLPRAAEGVWRQVKDRLFARIHGSSLKDLNEVGIHRFMTFTMVLLRTCPDALLIQFLRDTVAFFDQIPVGRLDYRKLRLLFSGFYALMHICNAREVSFQLVALKCSKLVDKITRFLTSKTLNSEQFHEVLKVYLHEMSLFTDLLRASKSPICGQTSLIPVDSLRSLLDILQATHISSILNFIAELLFCLRLNLKNTVSNNEEFIEFSKRLLNEILPWLKRVALQHQDEHENLSDITSDLILLWMMLDPPTSTESLSSKLWRYFACDAQLSIQFRCQYLNRCLENTQFLRLLNGPHSIKASRPNQAAGITLADVALQGWIACSVVLALDNSFTGLSTLTRCIAKLDIIKTIVTSAESHFDFVTFLREISAKHKSTEGFMERIGLTNKVNLWFGTVADTIHRCMKESTFTPSIFHALALTFQHCAPILHPRKPSFVSRVLDLLILNSSDGKLEEARENAQYLHLHKFIHGCILIGRKDFYISEVLKQIMKLYLTRWPCVGADGSKHPFLRVLLGTSSGSVITVVQREMVQLLYETLQTDTQTHRLATVVEIIYEWRNTGSTTAEEEQTPNFKAVLLKIRPQLRFNKTLFHKLEFLVNSY